MSKWSTVGRNVSRIRQQEDVTSSEFASFNNHISDTHCTSAQHHSSLIINLALHYNNSSTHHRIFYSHKETSHIQSTSDGNCRQPVLLQQSIADGKCRLEANGKISIGEDGRDYRFSSNEAINSLCAVMSIWFALC